MKTATLQSQSTNLATAILCKRVATASLGILFAVTASVTCADVASRVQESNSTTHQGVLAYVRDASPQGRKAELAFFGQGLRKVSAAAPGFQIQIVEREDIPGGALPGSFVILTPRGDKVVATQRRCNTVADLRSLVASSSVTLRAASVAAVPYFEYDH